MAGGLKKQKENISPCTLLWVYQDERHTTFPGNLSTAMTSTMDLFPNEQNFDLDKNFITA